MRDGLDRRPAYDVAEAAGVRFSWRRGCRGHPTVPAGWRLLVEVAPTLGGELVDASGTLGIAARAAVSATRVQIVESSAIALEAIRDDLARQGPEVIAGLPWDLEPNSVETLLLAPPAERGSARVRAELASTARSLRPEGVAYLLLDKDRGAKRYEREAHAHFGEVEVVARHRGARLSRLRRPLPDATPTPWSEFEVDGARFQALAGCFAAGKLDPGSALLLRAIERAGALPAGASAWDLGCGWGALAHAAHRNGAEVTASDDDLAAVRSCRANLAEAVVHHADLDANLDPDSRFDRVLINPPFHVGAAVRVSLGREFLEVALRRAAHDGEVWLVANAALPYEREAPLPHGWRMDEVAREGGFKVLRAWPRSSR